MRVYLKVLQGKSSGKTVKIPTNKFLIGRAESCHLRPKSDSISRKHCVILTTENGVSIRDLNSRNGTHVNDSRIEEETEIVSGDILRIGRLSFELLVKDAVKKSRASDGTDSSRNEPGSSIVEDVDISDWLDEPSADISNRADPDTRQYRLDETERVTLQKARDEAEEDTDTNSDSEATQGEKSEKQKPGKLPTAATQSADSREAAEEMLKRFFNRR